MTFEVEEDGVSSAVIDAGNYQLNEFYGVPIFHHFHKTGESGGLDFRVTSSMAARIEGYDQEGKLLFIDGNGNGSFLDPGDVLYRDADKSGYPDFPLSRDEAVFRLQVFPKGAAVREGLHITIQGKNGKTWDPLSIDHLAFPLSE